MNKQVKIYAKNLGVDTLAQFNSAMAKDFVIKGALMPDAHLGYSLPIGSVVATRDVVVPAWVGYDIGCGVCALKVGGVNREDLEGHRKDIFKLIYERIPVGFNVNQEGIAYSLEGLTEKGREIAVKKRYDLALGSLGGGNHFIELGYDEVGSVWIVIHSGSRGVGYGIAAHYMTLASCCTEGLAVEFDAKSQKVLQYNPDNYERLKRRFINKRLAKARPTEGNCGLHTGSEQGKDYIKDLKWCLDFALENRKVMVGQVIDVLRDITELEGICPYGLMINRNHNHAVESEGLWVHRKGATHAEEGMLGVIPGNMRDGSFIVRGKGNPDSLFSSSHGAGRVMGRKQASRELSMDEFRATMHRITASVGEDTLDEAPLAYKDIVEVMELQSDLVEILHHITPMINIKG